MELLTSRLTGLLLALGLSFTLWVLIVNQQNPEVTTELGTLIPVEAINTPPDLLRGSDLPQVRLTITTSQDYLLKVVPDKLKAWVDLSNGTRGAREYPIQVQSSDPKVKIVSANPSAVTVRLDPVARKEVPVRAIVTGTLPEGYSTNNQQPRATPERVTVSGAQTLVDSVEEADVIVRIDGARANISQSVRPQPMNGQGVEVRDVTVTPSTVLVELAVTRQTSTKVVPLRPQLVGTVRAGYQIVSSDVNPPAIAVIGDPSVVDGLDALNTSPVDVRNASSDIVQQVDVSLPPGVSMSRPERPTVHVGITPIEGSQTIRVGPVAQNVPEGLEASFNRTSVNVQVAGPEPALATLRPEDIHVTVDLADAVAGTRTVTPTVTVPSPSRVTAVDPPQLEVTLRETPPS